MFNPSVIKEMNDIIAKFPSKAKLIEDMSGKGSLSELMRSASEQQQQQKQIKECIESTQRFQLAMISQ